MWICTKDARLAITSTPALSLENQHLACFPLARHLNLAALHCVAAWQPGAKMLPASACTRSSKTALNAAAGGGKSLTETMASSLAEALGVEADGAEERFNIGGGGYGGGGGASVGTIDDKVTGDKVRREVPSRAPARPLCHRGLISCKRSTTYRKL